MGPTRAHALFQAGMRTPSEVFAADETKLKEALAKALARGMQRRNAGKVAAGGTMEAMQVRPRQLSCRLALPMQQFEQGLASLLACENVQQKCL